MPALEAVPAVEAMGMPLPARVTLAAGVLGLSLCLSNQWTTAELSPALQRSGVLAGLLSVGLMLVALLWTRAVPEAPERVELPGDQGLDLVGDLPQTIAEELGWGSQMLLTATPAASVLVHWQGRTLLRRGVLAQASFNPGAICARAASTDRAISLVNLALYPGRDEFKGLPEGVPAVLIQPMGPQGWVLLGGWSARCFSRSDETWLKGWSQRLRTSLERWDAAGEPSVAAPGGS
ncbi:cofactor assembly of complex C subunit B [Cyanobium sp. ATX 6F1]|uniref:cofactor assembly of complex C subunit B n=1 Tax=unclassified Cyanobium TaxID=2627006 RepID=UPI0028F4441F|nr:cofactor assembly of complex C subunit B [Cyanobium sp. ATX 6F1]